MRVAHAIATVVAFNRPHERIYWETLDGDGLISRSRSQLATKFLREPDLADADVMVFVDDDVHFSTPDFMKIVDGARRTGDIYGGLYVTRDRRTHLTSQGWRGQRIEFENRAEPKPVDIRWMTTGFMAFTRPVLQAIVNADIQTNQNSERVSWCPGNVEGNENALPMYDFFRPFIVADMEQGGSNRHLSEDWAFCERARQAGFKVWADASIILGHRGMATFTVHDLGDTGHAVGPDGAPGAASSVLAVGQDGELQDVAEQEERVAAAAR